MLPRSPFSASIVGQPPIGPYLPLGQVSKPNDGLPRPTHYTYGMSMLFKWQCYKP